MVGVSIQEWFEKYLENSQSPAAAHKRECLTCRTALSDYLDAYYGRDPFEAQRCSKCRSPKKKQ